MERSAIIASVVAGAGILIAGTVAGTAAVNAAASSEPDPSTTQLVAAPAVALQPAQAAVTLPQFAAESLPPISLPTMPADTAQPQAAAPAAGAPAQTRSAKPGAARPADESPGTAAPAAASTPGTAATPIAPAQAAPALAPEQAVALVVAASGGVAQEVRQASHSGYDAWAVTVKRPDGSIVTGFVDQVTATIYDWRIVQEAPKPAPAATVYQDDDGEYEDDDEYEHDDKYENDDEHEGDGDDD